MKMVGLCRLCASLRKKDVLITIQDDRNEICQKLYKCCQFSIQMQDPLPKSVCRECMENLNSSHKFYMKVQEAQETLQALFPTTEDKEDTSENESSALAQTLVRHWPRQNKKRKISTNEKKQRLSKTQEEITETDVEKTKKQKVSPDDISTKNIKKESIKINPTKKSPEHIIVNSDNDSESLETSANDKYLQEVYYMLGMTKEEAEAENNFEMLETIDEKEVGQHEPIYVENQVDECLEEQHLENHYILEENVREDIIESINQEILTEKVNQDSEYKELHSDLQYLEDEDENEEEEVELEEEEEEVQSEKEVELVKKDGQIEKHVLLQINSWKSYTHPCAECEYKTTSFIDLEAHAEFEHGIKNKLLYKCYDCQKVIPRYNFYLNHIRSKHPALKLKCDICDLNCQNYEQLSFHRSVNCSEATKFTTLLPCTQCFKSFHSTQGLQTHIKLQHTKTKEKYQCLQCGKEFQQKHHLKAHELLHADNKKYSCTMCDSTFNNKSGLELHSYTHIEEKTFKCNICDKSFKTFITLDQHKIIHSDYKKFKCLYCDKEFRTKIAKISHERTHTGEMPFQCDQCHKRFRFLSAFNAHIKSHSGVKPFACEYCFKKFSDSSNRKKHVTRKHPNGKDENTQK